MATRLFSNLGRPRMNVSKVTSLEERVEILQGLVRGDGGVRHPELRRLAVQIVRDCPDRNEGCELAAIFHFVKANVRYTSDIHGIDTYQSPVRTIQFGGGDCFVEGTQMLRDDHVLVPVEHVRQGDRIWGLDRWSEVEAVWAKGPLPVDAVRLNNGSWMRLTSGHKAYVARCDRHEARNAAFAADEGGPRPCSCPVPEREVVRVLVGDLRPGDVLTAPDRIPFGKAGMDPDRAYIEGLYLSDGWCEDYRFGISGQDGSPKEAQKREVEAACARLGIPTTWARKYIRVRDSEWTARLAGMGGHAPDKRMLSLDVDEATAAAYLRGIMVDSGANTRGLGRTFTTTSRTLWLQARLLHRMFGGTCGASYIEDHGGPGANPIWRLTTRTERRKDGKPGKLLRVREIERSVAVAPCWDLTTDDHKVYLPEADVTVSNCDDHSSLICALASCLGFQSGFRVVSTQGKTWEHIYAIAGSPKRAPAGVVALDTTVPSSWPGWEPPNISHKRDFFPLDVVG